MVQEISQKLIALGFILALVIFSIITIRPIILSIFAGLILAYIFYPTYKRILKVVREKNISATIIVLLLLFILFIPMWFLFPIIARQIFDAYVYSQNMDITGTFQNFLASQVSKDALVVISNFFSHSTNLIFTKLSNILLDLPNILLQLVVVLFVFFFGMRDGEKLKEYIKGVSPFSKQLEENLSTNFKSITNSVIYGHIVVGIIQGILTGIGLLIAGVPNMLMLTVIAIFASVLPILGSWLVWIPAVIYLFVSGHTGSAIFLLLYCAIIVSWIDNILRPYIISRRTNLSSGVVFVGMIGGLIAFGIMGLVLGPLLLAYLIVIADAFRDKKLTEFFSK